MLFLRAVRAADGGSSEDRPETRAARKLQRGLDQATKAGTSVRDALARADRSALCSATVSVRAATDLLRTYVDPVGAIRGPEMEDLVATASSRRSASQRALWLLDTALAAAPATAAAALTFGAPWTSVRSALPDLGPLQAATRRLIGSSPAEPESLQELEPALAVVRVGHPLEELADRLVRLRRSAWAHARQKQPAVEDLKTYAVLGVAVAAHAEAFFSLERGGAREAPPEPAREQSRLADWDEIRRTIHPWRGQGLPDPTAAADLRAVGRLLGEIAPLDSARRGATGLSDREVRASLRGGVAMTCDIARWNQRTIEHLYRDGGVVASARMLPRSLVSGSGELAASRLAGRTVPVPREALSAAAWLYHAVGAPVGIGPARPRATELERSLETVVLGLGPAT